MKISFFASVILCSVSISAFSIEYDEWNRAGRVQGEKDFYQNAADRNKARQEEKEMREKVLQNLEDTKKDRRTHGWPYYYDRCTYSSCKGVKSDRKLEVYAAKLMGEDGLGWQPNEKGVEYVPGALRACKTILEEDKVAPYEYMGCAALLAWLGTHDCKERWVQERWRNEVISPPTCTSLVQGALYFGLHGAVGCSKSFEGNKGRIYSKYHKDPKTKQFGTYVTKEEYANYLASSFAWHINQSKLGVYGEETDRANSMPKVVWHATAKEVGGRVIEKVLEFGFEKIAFNGAAAAVGAAGTPLLIFAGIELFYELGEVDRVNTTCLNWQVTNNEYLGSESYGRVSGLIRNITGH